jgi:hypothetical protein
VRVSALKKVAKDDFRANISSKLSRRAQEVLSLYSFDSLLCNIVRDEVSKETVKNDPQSEFFDELRQRHLLVFQFTWKLIFFNHDIFRMTFFLIMCIDIKIWLTFGIFSLFLIEMKLKKYKQNICNNVSSITLKFVDDFASTFNRHSYAKRWSMKF